VKGLGHFLVDQCLPLSSTLHIQNYFHIFIDSPLEV
jgi:hypothetical protein